MQCYLGRLPISHGIFYQISNRTSECHWSAGIGDFQTVGKRELRTDYSVVGAQIILDYFADYFKNMVRIKCDAPHLMAGQEHYKS